MKKSLAMIRTFLADEDGATAVEYGLMVALIAVVIIASGCRYSVQTLNDIFN